MQKIQNNTMLNLMRQMKNAIIYYKLTYNAEPNHSLLVYSVK